MVNEYYIRASKEFIRDYEPDHIVGLFSGGKDSSYTVKWFHDNVHTLTEVLNIDTTVCIPDTRAYITKFCQTFFPGKWSVFKGPHSYRDLVLKYGFFGPGGHGMAFTYLKERALRKFKRERTGKILFISGVRKHESARRMLTTKFLTIESGRCVFLAPIMDATDTMVADWVNNSLPFQNETWSKMCFSGECCCGSFASKGERDALKLYWPEWFKETIEDLEKEVQEKIYDEMKKATPEKRKYLQKKLSRFGVWAPHTICPRKAAELDKTQSSLKAWGCSSCYQRSQD